MAFLLRLHFVQKDEEKEKWLRSAAVDNIEEMEPNRYSRGLKRLLLCLSTRQVGVTVLSDRVRLCVQLGGEQEARNVDSWPSYCEIERNKKV